MHSYNTRFAVMNRSFGRASDDDDAEYLPSHNVPSGGRRPVTRSMTRLAASSAQRFERRAAPAPERRVTRSMASAVPERRVTRSMASAVPERRVTRSMASAVPERRVTRSMASAAAAAVATRRTGSTHPMVLRSARR